MPDVTLIVTHVLYHDVGNVAVYANVLFKPLLSILSDFGVDAHEVIMVKGLLFWLCLHNFLTISV